MLLLSWWFSSMGDIVYARWTSAIFVITGVMERVKECFITVLLHNKLNLSWDFHATMIFDMDIFYTGDIFQYCEIHQTKKNKSQFVFLHIVPINPLNFPHNYLAPLYR